MQQTKQEIDQEIEMKVYRKRELETVFKAYIPKLITTYDTAAWILDNPEVYQEYLRRSKWQ